MTESSLLTYSGGVCGGGGGVSESDFVATLTFFCRECVPAIGSSSQCVRLGWCSGLVAMVNRKSVG